MCNITWTPPGGVKDSGRTERVCEREQGRGRNLQLSPADRVCSGGSGDARSRLRSVCDPGGSEQLQRTDQVRTSTILWLSLMVLE